MNYTYQNINFQTNDQVLSGKGTFLSKDRKMGASVFINNRARGFYDHNADRFSELSMLQNTSFGLKTFFLPNQPTMQTNRPCRPQPNQATSQTPNEHERHANTKRTSIGARGVKCLVREWTRRDGKFGPGRPKQEGVNMSTTPPSSAMTCCPAFELLTLQ